MMVPQVKEIVADEISLNVSTAIAEDANPTSNTLFLLVLELSLPYWQATRDSNRRLSKDLDEYWVNLGNSVAESIKSEIVAAARADSKLRFRTYLNGWIPASFLGTTPRTILSALFETNQELGISDIRWSLRAAFILTRFIATGEAHDTVNTQLNDIYETITQLGEPPWLTIEPGKLANAIRSEPNGMVDASDTNYLKSHPEPWTAAAALAAVLVEGGANSLLLETSYLGRLTPFIPYLRQRRTGHAVAQAERVSFHGEVGQILAEWAARRVDFLTVESAIARQ